MAVGGCVEEGRKEDGAHSGGGGGWMGARRDVGVGLPSVVLEICGGRKRLVAAETRAKGLRSDSGVAFALLVQYSLFWLGEANTVWDSFSLLQLAGEAEAEKSSPKQGHSHLGAFCRLLHCNYRACHTSTVALGFARSGAKVFILSLLFLSLVRLSLAVVAQDADPLTYCTNAVVTDVWNRVLHVPTCQPLLHGVQ